MGGGCRRGAAGSRLGRGLRARSGGRRRRGCAAMGGQVTRSLLYGKDAPAAAGGGGEREAAGKGEAGAPRGGGGVGMRALPGSSSRSIPLPERGRPEGTPGLGRARLAELPGSRDERLPERRGRARREGSGAAGERRCPWVCAA